MNRHRESSETPGEELFTSTQRPSGARVSAEDLNLKVQQAQEILSDLKRRQQDIERQKVELEDLTRKQREFEEGQRLALEKLTRGLVILERQEHQVKKEAEQIQFARETFGEHLSNLQSIDPRQWDGDNLAEELNRALAHVDQAKTIYEQSRARIEALRDLNTREDSETTSWEQSNPTASAPLSGELPFLTMVRAGFAYSLPVVAVLLLWLAVHLMAK